MAAIYISDGLRDALKVKAANELKTVGQLAEQILRAAVTKKNVGKKTK